MSLSDSPFTSRLNTNYVPSPSETLEIRSLLVDPIEEIARIDTQIAEMESVLTQLREKRALLQLPIDAHKALISPMRHIPQDILLEIFFACLPSEHNAVIDSAEAPLLFGRVSRHWRSVAYSTPMLWSSIHIPALDYLNTSPDIFSGLERTVEAWLERSATCPLSVSLSHLTSRRVGLDYTSKKHSLVLQILAVSRRLRYLTLAADADFLGPILEFGAENFPLLKSIRMNVPNQTIPKNFFEIPTLEDVALCAALSAPLSLPLPWSQLRILCLLCWIQHDDQAEGVDINGASELLRRCPNLEWCEIWVTQRSEDLGLAHNQSSIILPHLHTLALSGWDFRLENWIDLVAPNLYYLQIGEGVGGIPRSSQAPMSVVLNSSRFTRTSIHQLLQSFPTISHLQLLTSERYDPGRIFLDDEFMALFCPPHNLCPMLSDVSFLPSASFSDAAALAFIKARIAMPTPLRRFHAEFNRSMEFDVIPELQSFILDGLQVTIYYSEPRQRFTARDGLEQPGLFH
ncbi:hypothetical protein C8R45DRAFT_1208214 [Mycena sanguinolenta]|nr:hypothetical protein C8R45DRAFT_1208214 [Mycena sanguinolenta]